MLAICGGADISLILTGLHRVKELVLVDLNDKQFDVFKSKKEFIENDPLGLNYLLFYYIPKNEKDDFSIFSKFLPRTKDFVEKNLEEIVESKKQLYPLFFEEYIDALSYQDGIYEYLSNETFDVNYVKGDILDFFSKDFDVVYLSNVIDFIPIRNLSHFVEELGLLKDDVVIYDSSKFLNRTMVPYVNQYSKKELIMSILKKF